MTVIVGRGVAFDTTSGRMNLVVDATVSIAVAPAETAALSAAVSAARTDDARSDALTDAVDAVLMDLVSRAMGERVRVVLADRAQWDTDTQPPA